MTTKVPPFVITILFVIFVAPLALPAAVALLAPQDVLQTVGWAKWTFETLRSIFPYTKFAPGATQLAAPAQLAHLLSCALTIYAALGLMLIYVLDFDRVRDRVEAAQIAVDKIRSLLLLGPIIVIGGYILMTSTVGDPDWAKGFANHRVRFSFLKLCIDILSAFAIAGWPLFVKILNDRPSEMRR